MARTDLPVRRPICPWHLFHAPTVMLRLSCSDCHAPTVMLRLSCSDCHAPTVMLGYVQSERTVSPAAARQSLHLLLRQRILSG